MELKQIYTWLNDEYAERATLNGAKVELKADLSNIVDFGRALTANETIQNLMGTAGNLIDKVRKTIFIDTEFRSNAPDCFFDTEAFIGLTEIVRVGGNDFEESLEFDCLGTKKGIGNNSFEKLFGKNIPDVKAKYYTQHTPYSQKLTVTKDQFAAAFTSPSEMNRMFSMWENQLKQRRDFAKEALQYAAFDSAVLEVCAQRADDCVVTLKADATHADFFKAVKKAVRRLRDYNNAYAAEDFVTSVSDDNLRVAVFGDYMDEIEIDKANIYNPQYWSIPVGNVKELSYFQFASSDANRQTISGIADSTTTGKYGKVDKVLAVIYDKRVCGCTIANESMETSPYIANEKCFNIFDLATMQYIVNGDLPLVVITANGGGYSEADIA